MANWNNTVPRELAACLRDRGEDRAADWLHEFENDDVVWDLIGGVLDRIVAMSRES